MKRFLHKLKIPYFESTGNHKKGDRLGVRVLTFHGMKGLEFKQIFLTDVNARTIPILPANFNAWDVAEQGAYLQSERALLYVAFKRATESVQVTGIGQKSEMIDC